MSAARLPQGHPTVADHELIALEIRSPEGRGPEGNPKAEAPKSEDPATPLFSDFGFPSGASAFGFRISAFGQPSPPLAPWTPRQTPPPAPSIGRRHRPALTFASLAWMGGQCAAGVPVLPIKTRWRTASISAEGYWGCLLRCRMRSSSNEAPSVSSV